MSRRTVDWVESRAGDAGPPPVEGLRERKKRLMRQQLSATATEMFMERGFDAVRVSEIAEACGVSEKTVFNYFPTKESLILDRWDASKASLRAGLADPAAGPVEAVLRILSDELGRLTDWLAAQDDPDDAAVSMQRFATLITATPALRAHHHDMLDQLTAVAAEILAERAGTSPDDPGAQIAAAALLGLWHIQSASLTRHLGGGRTPAQVDDAVTADVRRAAGVLEAGLGSSSELAPGPR